MDRSDRQCRRSNFIRVTVDRTRRGRTLFLSLSYIMKRENRAFARSAHSGMEKAAHRSLRRRKTEAIDVIRGSLGLWKALIARPDVISHRRETKRCSART